MEHLRIIPAWSLENYTLLLTYPKVVPVLLKTLRIAGTVVVITFVLGCPLGYYLAFKVSGAKQTVLSLSLIFPFFIGVICRTYAWRVLLGYNGVINSSLIFLGLIKEPLQDLLFSEYALHIVLVYNYVLFMVFPIFISMQRIDRRLFEASASLGANSLRTFLKVALPLSMPGIMAGCLFVFISVCTAYAEPALIGGPAGFMFANMIGLQFGMAYQWPLGAAMGIIMLIIVLVLCSAFVRFVGLERIFKI